VIDEREIVRVAVERLAPPEPSYERLVRRRDRKRRNQRIAAGVVGIALFVAAVWIVTSVRSLDRSQRSVVPGGDVTGPAAETGPAVAVPPPAPASAAPDVVTEEMCSDGAILRLELTGLRYRIEVRFEVHQSPLGNEWRIVLRRVRGIPNDSRDTVVFFRGTRVAAEDGEVVVQRRVWDTIRFDWVLAKAVDTQRGQVCRVDATIPE
jgi:hypothetical protein